MRTALERAVAFLEEEVQSWPREKGCFSCHNNGDAARALYVAMQHGFHVERQALEETEAWLTAPGQWHEGGEDQPFKDKKLSTVQFAAALLEAGEAGAIEDRTALRTAASLLVQHQSDDGAWHIDRSGFGGSPITYGQALATALARRTLVQAGHPDLEPHSVSATRWLQTSDSQRVVDAAGILLGLAEVEGAAARGQRSRCLELLLAAQADSGGWGLFADYESEPFDTAMAMIALASVERTDQIEQSMHRGQDYLLANQAIDGTWPETTRPPGGQSYAHRVSTTAWATIALLEVHRSGDSTSHTVK